MGKRQTLRAVVVTVNPDFPLLSERREIEVTGRFAQTLKALVEAGEKGVKALDLSNWAVRLGHYIWVLRHKRGLVIETIQERHEGEFPGKHGLYVLRSQVEIIDDLANRSSAAA